MKQTDKSRSEELQNAQNKVREMQEEQANLKQKLKEQEEL